MRCLSALMLAAVPSQGCCISLSVGSRWFIITELWENAWPYEGILLTLPCQIHNGVCENQTDCVELKNDNQEKSYERGNGNF